MLKVELTCTNLHHDHEHRTVPVASALCEKAFSGTNGPMSRVATHQVACSFDRLVFSSVFPGRKRLLKEGSRLMWSPPPGKPEGVPKPPGVSQKGIPAGGRTRDLRKISTACGQLDHRDKGLALLDHFGQQCRFGPPQGLTKLWQ